VTVDPPNPIVERAVALSAAGPAADGAARELVTLAGDDPGPLGEARRLLVLRLTHHGDDYEASRALTVINAAIAELGWHGAHTWTPRERRLRNLY
jgi:hypothetical protein